MEFGNYNLMELMTDGIGFGQQIEKENNDLKIEGKITYEDVAKYFASPTVKKMVW